MRGRESTNDSLKWELLGYAAVIDLSSSLRGGTKIPSVLEAEERVVNIFHGKTTQTLPPPPPTISRATFLVKASVFSPLAQHKILFHPLLLPMPAGPARQQKYGFLWKRPLHAECQALLESKTWCCLESSGRNGPLCAGSRFALPCLQHLPFPRVPQG